MSPESTGRACAKCGERVQPEVLICPFCHAPILAPTAHGFLRRTVRDALTAWARTVRGAPYKFAELVRSLEVRDEVVRRVATEVVRREFRWHTLPSVRRSCTGQNIDPDLIDPFSISLDDLRMHSEHLRVCTSCDAEGSCVCAACSLSGEVHCPRCLGSGTLTKLSLSGRLAIACEACNQTGWVTCEACSGSGQVACKSCSGDGYHIAWLSYDESTHWLIDASPSDSPVLVAYPHLSAPTALTSADLTAFTVKARFEAEAPLLLMPDDDAGRDTATRAFGEIEPRLERVRSQQYVRLGVVRRDVGYAMCATTGNVVLCGRDLIGVTTAEALRPIRLRNALWIAFAIAMALVGRIGVIALQGHAAYFATSNLLLDLLWVVATVASLPVIGGFLRSLRNGRGQPKLRAPERALEYCFGVCVIAMLALKIAVQPKAPEAKSALIDGQTKQARIVVDALKEAWGETPEIRRIENDVLVAEAVDFPLEQRLRVLDDVAMRGGRQAGEAAVSARSYRLQEVRRLLEIGAAPQALARIDAWFADTWSSDPELMEMRAAAHEQQFSRCTDDLCRWIEAGAANRARENPERTESMLAARQRLLDSLSTKPVAKPDPALEFAQREQLLIHVAREEAALHDDTELAERARAALAQPLAERTLALTMTEPKHKPARQVRPKPPPPEPPPDPDTTTESE